MLDSVVVAYVFAGLIIIALMIDAVRSLWKQNAFGALRSSGLAFGVLGLIFVLAYQNEWAQYNFGGDVAWGRLNEWVYLSPFMLGTGLLVAAGMLRVVQRIRGMLSSIRDRAALAPAEAEVRETGVLRA